MRTSALLAAATLALVCACAAGQDSATARGFESASLLASEQLPWGPGALSPRAQGSNSPSQSMAVSSTMIIICWRWAPSGDWRSQVETACASRAVLACPVQSPPGSRPHSEHYQGVLGNTRQQSTATGGQGGRASRAAPNPGDPCLWRATSTRRLHAGVHPAEHQGRPHGPQRVSRRAVRVVVSNARHSLSQHACHHHLPCRTYTSVAAAASARLHWCPSPPDAHRKATRAHAHTGRWTPRAAASNGGASLPVLKRLHTHTQFAGVVGRQPEPVRRLVVRRAVRRQHRRQQHQQPGAVAKHVPVGAAARGHFQLEDAQGEVFVGNLRRRGVLRGPGPTGRACSQGGPCALPRCGPFAQLLTPSQSPCFAALRRDVRRAPVCPPCDTRAVAVPDCQQPHGEPAQQLVHADGARGAGAARQPGALGLRAQSGQSGLLLCVLRASPRQGLHSSLQGSGTGGGDACAHRTRLEGRGARTRPPCGLICCLARGKADTVTERGREGEGERGSDA